MVPSAGKTAEKVAEKSAAPANSVGECKPMRADAARNRDKLLKVATQAFTEKGADASLDHIAKAAGVGIGTLYRHFPTREDLVMAVYSRQIDALEERSHDLPCPPSTTRSRRCTSGCVASSTTTPSSRAWSRCCAR